MRAVIGIGNPGSSYEGTRHNAGFLAVETMAGVWQFPPFKRPWRWRARVSKGSFGDQDVTLVKPQTYVNRSGAALGPLLAGADFEPSRDLLVVVDDVALPVGSIRIRPSGSEGGHNGLKSISGRLASRDYARLRIGVGPVPPGEDQSDFVLSEFGPEELEQITGTLAEVVKAVECWIEQGVETAMNSFNRRGTQRD